MWLLQNFFCSAWVAGILSRKVNEKSLIFHWKIGVGVNPECERALGGRRDGQGDDGTGFGTEDFVGRFQPLSLLLWTLLSAGSQFDYNWL